MILMPGCPCCGVCAWPDSTPPDSIEVDIGHTTETVYSAGTFSAKSVDKGGTYSLGPAVGATASSGVYLYENASASLYRIQIEAASLFGEMAISITIGLKTVEYSTFSSSWIYLQPSLFTPFAETCAPGDLYRWKPMFSEASGYYNGGTYVPTDPNSFDNFSAAWDASCYLPGSFSVRRYIQGPPAGSTASTFPYYKTAIVNSITRYYQGYLEEVSVEEIRYVYGTSSVVAFGNVSGITCGAPP